MPVSYPLQLSRTYCSKQPGDRWSGPLSAANGYRWVGAGVVTLPANFDSTTNNWTSAATASDINGLLAFPVWLDANDPAAADQAAIVQGPVEVADASIKYGDLDISDTNARLREIGIIVRASVALPE